MCRRCRPPTVRAATSPIFAGRHRARGTSGSTIAIYDPHGADDNEEDSASVADRDAGRSGGATEFPPEIRRLILATGHRGVRSPGDDSSLQ